METGRAVDPLRFGAPRVRFPPLPPNFKAPLAQSWQRRRSQKPEVLGSNPRRGTIRRCSPIWQRRQVESLVVVGSTPTVGTIPGSVAQLAEASDSKPVTVWVRLPPEPPWRGD